MKMPSYPKYSENEPLHRAVDLDEFDKVKQLLDEGMPPDARTIHHVTPFMVAARRGRKAIAELLIERGADVNARDRRSAVQDGRCTPLHYACETGQLKMVELLLDHGADPDSATQNWRTPLSDAIFLHHKFRARCLLERGASPNGPEKCGMPPIVAAAWNDDLEMLAELLRRGADPNRKAHENEFALYVTRSIECARELLAKGADVNMRNMEGYTVLIGNLRNITLELLDCYIKAGLDVNAKDKAEMPALMHLSRCPRLEIAKALVGAGADINAPTKKGFTILDDYQAMCRPDSEEQPDREAIMNYLHSKGAMTGKALKMTGRRLKK